MIFGYGDYQQGDTGTGVWQLQTNLNKLGISSCGTADGIFGPNTAACVRAFQAAAGRDPTGVADEGTLIALATALQKRGIAPASDRPSTGGTGLTTVPSHPTTTPPAPGALPEPSFVLPTPVKALAVAAAGFALFKILGR